MFVLCCRTVVLFVCLSASLLSVCDVGVLWPNGWTDQPETWVGLHPCHIVLDGDPAPLPKIGDTAPTIFGPCLLWTNGYMDQDATWYGGRPRPKSHCARWGPSPPQKVANGGTAQFLAHVCCGQTAGWIKMKLGLRVGLGPGHIGRWGPSSYSLCLMHMTFM